MITRNSLKTTNPYKLQWHSMSPSWYLMQFCLRAQPQVPLGMIFSALTITSCCLADAWWCRQASRSISRQELMEIYALAADWP